MSRSDANISHVFFFVLQGREYRRINDFSHTKYEEEIKKSKKYDTLRNIRPNDAQLFLRFVHPE